MKTVQYDIKKWLEEELKPLDIKVEIGYNNNRTSKFPLIVIQEIQNDTVNQIKGREYATKLAYQIDVFAPTMKFEGKVQSGRVIVETVGFKIDDILKQKWFTRIDSPLGNISNIDPTYNRYCLRYKVGIDDNDIIFRV